MRDTDYHALKAVSASLLKQVAKSPAHAKAFLDGLFVETAAQAAGQLGHMLVLERHRVETEVAVYTGRRAGKQWEEWEANHTGKTIVTETEMDEAMARATAVRSNPHAKALLAQGKPEVTIQWEVDGEPAKSRIDWLSDSALVDVKFTRDASPFGYGREAVKYGLPLQAAFYTDAVLAQTGLELPFYVICCEPCPVCSVTVFRVPPEVVTLGRAQYRRALRTLKACRESGTWGSYADGIVDLQLPQWAYEDETDD